MIKKYKVTVNGTCYEVEVEEIKNTERSIENKNEVKEINQTNNAKTYMDKDYKGVIKAPLSGSISKIVVSEGDNVKIGDTLLILEAMKMENEIKSNKDGVVKAIKIQKGSLVNTKDILVIVE